MNQTVPPNGSRERAWPPAIVSRALLGLLLCCDDPSCLPGCPTGKGEVGGANHANGPGGQTRTGSFRLTFQPDRVNNSPASFLLLANSHIAQICRVGLFPLVCAGNMALHFQAPVGSFQKGPFSASFRNSPRDPSYTCGCAKRRPAGS